MEPSEIRSITVRFRGSKATFGAARYCQANLPNEFMNDLTPVNQIVIGKVIVNEKPKEPMATRAARARIESTTPLHQISPNQCPTVELTPKTQSPPLKIFVVEDLQQNSIDDIPKPPTTKKARFDSSRTIGIAIAGGTTIHPSSIPPSSPFPSHLSVHIPDDCSSAPSTAADTIMSSMETASEPSTPRLHQSELTIKPSLDYCSIYWKQCQTFGKRKCLEMLDSATMQIQCSSDFWLWFELYNFFQQIQPQTFDFSILELLYTSKHSEKTNKRTWYTPLEDLPEDTTTNIEYMKTKAYQDNVGTETNVASLPTENPLIALGNTQEKVEEYYDIYKEEFNSLLTLIQEKLQQQQSHKQSIHSPMNTRRGVSSDVVTDRLSIMEQLLSQHKLQINHMLANIRRKSVEQPSFWTEYETLQQSIEHERMVSKRWNQSKSKKLKKVPIR